MIMADEVTALKVRIVELHKDCDDLREQLAAANAALTEMAPTASWRLDLPELPDAFLRVAMAALEAFAEGYAEYGEGAADGEGLAGQWGDMKRKIMKLRGVMWTGKQKLTRETPQEVLRDIIGHALLALEMMERGFTGGRD